MEVKADPKAGTWAQELIQRPWKNATYWLGLHGLFSLFSYTTQDHPPMGGTTLG